MVLHAVVASTSLNVLKVLSLVSTSLFLMLIAGVWLVSGEGVSGLAGHATALGAYFTNLDRFILPINDYHGFYLSWWFAWSIMIGQFVARFVSGIPVWQLAIALLVVPSIPIALWFTVLYSYFVDGETVGELITMAMIVVGILFVVNSLDSLTRLYSQNLNLTVERLGRSRYVLAHASFVPMVSVTPFAGFPLLPCGSYSACKCSVCWHQARSFGLISATASVGFFAGC